MHFDFETQYTLRIQKPQDLVKSNMYTYIKKIYVYIYSCTYMFCFGFVCSLALGPVTRIQAYMYAPVSINLHEYRWRCVGVDPIGDDDDNSDDENGDGNDDDGDDDDDYYDDYDDYDDGDDDDDVGDDDDDDDDVDVGDDDYDSDNGNNHDNDTGW